MNVSRLCLDFLHASRLALAAVGLMTILNVASCGGEGMSGVYRETAGGGDKIEFQGDKVYITISPAPTMAGEYELDGDKVILTISGSGGQSMVLTRRGNALEGGPFGKTFIKG